MTTEINHQPQSCNSPREPAEDLLNSLRELFPCAFGADPVRPLKIGIRHDIETAVGELDPHTLDEAMRRHCRSPAYRAACTAGARRVDLQGRPAGVVSDADAAFAASNSAEAWSKALARARQNRLREEANAAARKEAIAKARAAQLAKEGKAERLKRETPPPGPNKSATPPAAAHKAAIERARARADRETYRRERARRAYPVATAPSAAPVGTKNRDLNEIPF